MTRFTDVPVTMTLVLMILLSQVVVVDAQGVFCLICPDGGAPSKSTGLVGSRSCAEVYQQGLASELTQSECNYVQILLAQPQDTCGCLDGTATGPTDPPVTPSPTRSPTPLPTGSPTVDPRISCNVCGLDQPGLSEPDNFIDPSIGLSCKQFQDFAADPGLVPADCDAARRIAIPICGCPASSFLPTPSPVSSPSSPTVPTSPTTPSTPTTPTSPVASPTVSPEPKVFCTVCTDGRPTFSNKSIGGEICGALDVDGRNFQFTQSECLTIQAASSVAPDDPCECRDR